MDIQKTSAALLARPGIANAGLPDMNIPWVESPFFSKLLAEASFSDEQREQLQHFSEHGYVVFPLGDPTFTETAERIIHDLSLSECYSKGLRMQDAWKTHPDVRALALHSRVLELLQLLYQREPIAFQTLNFPRGTQQHTHSDTVHFHCVPHRFLCAAWVALEGVDTENGPLHVYPGSHRLPVLNFHDLGLPSGSEHYRRYEEGLERYVEALGLPKKILHVRKGDVIVWAANLLHGGERIVDSARSRHSQVTHYYFPGCLYYTPMHSDPYIGRVRLRTIVDVRTRRVVPNVYDGREIDMETFQSLRQGHFSDATQRSGVRSLVEGWIRRFF
jgi:hypothetical protein